MGNRGNIYLTNSKYGETDTEHGIYLYSHWSGHALPEVLRQALEFGRGRWNDGQYLQRIIADKAFKDVRDEETGAGLSLEIGDNSYPIVIVDVNRNTVSFADEDGHTDQESWKHTVTFAEYIAQDTATFPNDL